MGRPNKDKFILWCEKLLKARPFFKLCVFREPLGHPLGVVRFLSMDAVLLLVLLELYHINSCCSHILLCANLKNGLWLKFVFFKIMATFCLFFCFLVI